MAKESFLEEKDTIYLVPNADFNSLDVLRNQGRIVLDIAKAGRKL